MSLPRLKALWVTREPLPRKVGGAPENSGESWGLTVLAPECQVADGRQVAPGIMLGRNGEEVSK